MSYMHIENLYKSQEILLFRECYAMEKIHGTSAHVSWKDGQLALSPGGVSYRVFAPLFDEPVLREQFTKLGHPHVVVFGEAYGGSINKQSFRYGKAVKFVAFEVKIGESWLAVPDAESVVQGLGLEFVYYRKVSTRLLDLDGERDAPSEQCRRNGIAQQSGDKPREGIVLRPLIELTKNNGERIIAKHKRDDERETQKERPVVDPAKLEVLQEAESIAREWVTPNRLSHVLDKLVAISDGAQPDLTWMADLIRAMVEDVTREASGEIVDSKEARTAIGRKTAELFKAFLHDKLKESAGDQSAGSQ